MEQAAVRAALARNEAFVERTLKPALSAAQARQQQLEADAAERYGPPAWAWGKAGEDGRRGWAARMGGEGARLDLRESERPRGRTVQGGVGTGPTRTHTGVRASGSLRGLLGSGSSCGCS